MKKILCLFMAFIISVPSLHAQCVNGDVEMNNFTNWTGWTGANGTRGIVAWNQLIPGIVNGRQTIMNVGNDPLLALFGVNLPKVIEGNHSIRLGFENNGAANQAEMIAYTFQVTDAKFYFKYAMVIVDPGHIDEEKPFFS